MFKIAQSPTYWVNEIKVEFMQAEGGRPTVADFDVQFKRLSLDEYKSLSDEITESKLDDAEICRRVVTNFKRVGDGDGNELEFSAENLGYLVQAGAGGAIVKAFLRTLPKAKEKN